MRSDFVWLTSTRLFGIALALSNAAQAQSPSETEAPAAPKEASFLSVNREAGADSCPTTEELTAHVQRLRGHETTGEPYAYRVSFARQNGVFRASIRVGDASGVRVLRDRGATCASLEQATALTLALLLDSDAHELPPVEKAEPDSEPEPEPEPEAPPLRAPEPERRTHSKLAFSVGGGALFGVTQPVAPVVLGELGIGIERFRTGVGLLWMPTQKVDFAPGQLNETLVAGVARTCLSALRDAQLRLDVCSGIYAGLVKVQAKGYSQNDASDKAWLAVPVELSLGTTSSPAGVELGASALLPLKRSDFQIDNLGVAYDSWRVGMLLSLRAVGSWIL